MAQSRLFIPMKIGNIEVKHRIGMPGVSRLRSTKGHVPTQMMVEYYGQRACVPGTLLIAESSIVSPAMGGIGHAPGIYNQEQISAWKQVVDEVHRRGSFLFCELIAMGRAADPEASQSEGIEIVGPSAIPWNENAPIPKELTLLDIDQIVQDFTQAAKNAMAAGFDGVEIYAGNGYLLDNFLQDVSNQRKDQYGGSVENRSRFVHEILTSLTNDIGPSRVGLRLSPWSTFQGMRMKDTIPQFTDIITKASALDIAYISLIESRIAGYIDVESENRLDFAYNVWKGPVLVAGGYTPALARKLVEEHPEKDMLVLFGRYFTSNPDLVHKIENDIEFVPYDRSTFYDPENPVGYADWPFSKAYERSTGT